MLKGVDSLLVPELLKVLCEMGHGDEVVVVDANFTAESLGRGKPIVKLPGNDLQRVCRAVLSVFPLDESVSQPVAFMKVCDTPDGYTTELQQSVIELVQSMGGKTAAHCEAVERFAFYERVKNAYAIVQTGELRPYANFLFKKAVIIDPFA